MAIVKANYVRRGKQEKAGAKANIRYIQHRRGQDGTTITRPLFGSDGAMDRQEAYRMIDTAPKGSLFFRFKISPDPKTRRRTTRFRHARPNTQNHAGTCDESTPTSLLGGSTA